MIPTVLRHAEQIKALEACVAALTDVVGRLVRLVIGLAFMVLVLTWVVLR